MTTDDASAALGHLRYTLLVVGTNGAEGAHYMVANWGTQASFEPWRFVLCVKNVARTLQNVRERGAFTVNLLDASARDLVKDVMKGKRDGGAGGQGAVDAPRLPGAFAGIDGSLVQLVDVGGDHTLVVGNVVDGWTGEGKALALEELKLSYAG